MSVSNASPSSDLLNELVIAPETPFQAALVEGLFDRGFGPGRFAKTAERLREGNHPRLDLSRVALKSGKPMAAGRVWPIEIGGTPSLFFGPFAVDEAVRHHGLGRIILDATVEAARNSGAPAMLLVGSASYFEPSGFKVVPKGLLRLPGPVDPTRLLWLELQPNGFGGLSGSVTLPRVAMP